MDIKYWLDCSYNSLFAEIPNDDYLAYSNLPLLGKVFPVLLVDIAYLSFVFKFGPRLMKNRQPFQLKKVLMVYNATQVIACSFLVLVASYLLFFTDLYDFCCISKLAPNHKTKRVEVTIIYVAYLVKYLDYLDTIFFVLRKSYRQLTFLHVYHHLIVTMLSYLYIRDYGFGGHCVGAGYFNAIVHIFMYSYYFVAAHKPELKNSVWWKRHITELQIVQFLAILIHQMWPIIVCTDCKYPKFWLWCSSIQSIWFLYLFGKFYMNTYLRKKSLEKEKGYEKANESRKKII